MSLEGLQFVNTDNNYNPIDLSKSFLTKKTLPNQVSIQEGFNVCLLYTSPSPRDATLSRMPSSA